MRGGNLVDLGRMPEDGEGADFVRCCLAPFAVELECCLSIAFRTRMNEEGKEHVPADGIGAELERGDNTKVAAATLQRPKQVGVVSAAGSHEFAVSSYDVGRHETVTAKSVFTAEPTDASCQRQTSDSRFGDYAHGHGQPDYLRLMVKVTNRGATFCPAQIGRAP